MARGSIGRERMLSGVVGMGAHQPPTGGHQEDLNNELLAVSRNLSIHSFAVAFAIKKGVHRHVGIINSHRDSSMLIKHLLIADAAAIKISSIRLY
jgi:hypothetical protein